MPNMAKPPAPSGGRVGRFNLGGAPSVQGAVKTGTDAVGALENRLAGRMADKVKPPKPKQPGKVRIQPFGRKGRRFNKGPF